MVSSGVPAADVFGAGLGPNEFGQQGAVGVEDQQSVLFLDPVGDAAGEGAADLELRARA